MNVFAYEVELEIYCRAYFNEPDVGVFICIRYDGHRELFFGDVIASKADTVYANRALFNNKRSEPGRKGKTIVEAAVL